MSIDKRKVIPTLALIGLSIAATASAAEAAHTPHLDKLTPEQRELLRHARELRKEGRPDEARELIESSGIRLPFFKDPEQHKERKKATQEFESLIEQDDYETFREMVADTPMAEIIDTKEKFDALVRAHDLRAEGRADEAKDSLKEAGLMPKGRPFQTERHHRSTVN